MAAHPTRRSRCTLPFSSACYVVLSMAGCSSPRCDRSSHESARGEVFDRLSDRIVERDRLVAEFAFGFLVAGEMRAARHLHRLASHEWFPIWRESGHRLAHAGGRIAEPMRRVAGAARGARRTAPVFAGTRLTTGWFRQANNARQSRPRTIARRWPSAHCRTSTKFSPVRASIGIRPLRN